ncbi:CPBP family intramembrane glutamic endopeptidase [uncultured Imperialibacter sp.]|uniref:CPBP family intramembrane glutamic endopeptidase n=1 Tax=uncultured Imperialibacter sp. TaxID=1672639 RepID=UPI0030D831E8|tara:strand:+ start:882 stop:1595 length:714 start_codon:yes stop_codon:yes gene_type:complete
MKNVDESRSPALSKQSAQVQPLHALVDLAIFLSVMFLVREIKFDSLGFWGYSLFKSITTVGVATLLLYFRKQSWKDLGLLKPGSYKKMLVVAVIILLGTVVSIMIFEMFLRDILFTGTDSVSKSNSFSELEGNIPYFFSIIFFVWIESSLEELQDRGFSLSRFESLFTKIPLSTILAVLIQAAIFGFRHSYDFSPRSITTGLIGLVFGAVYVLTGRNIWPLIIAHIVLNTMSMVERI